MDMKLIDDLVGRMESESLRLQQFRQIVESDQGLPPVPRDAEREKKALARLARTPWLRLVCLSTAQPLKVSGYRDPEQGVDSPMWDTWLRNDMDSRQSQLNFAVVTFGYAFMQLTPGEDHAVMRPVSPQQMVAEYDDPYGDEYPLYALRKVRAGKYKFFDDERIVTLEGEGGDYRVVDEVKHSAGVCPVVLYPNLMDLEGNCFGEVEPYVDVAARLDLTTNDRLLVQRFNSWKILYATNIVAPKGMTEGQKERAKMTLRHDSVLMGTGDTKFGTLDETSMTPFITAVENDRSDLSAVSQTPMTMLTGEMINLGADAITNSYRPWREKLKQRRDVWGDAHARALRVAAALEGNREEAENFDAVVQWEDVEDRSLAQTADAFGKLAQMLEVPPEVLWGRIPGVSQSDVLEWKRLHEELRRRDLETEAMALQSDMSLQVGEESGGDLTQADGTKTPASYEDQSKPWDAKRGAKAGKRTVARLKRKDKRDGDGDGIVNE